MDASQARIVTVVSFFMTIISTIVLDSSNYIKQLPYQSRARTVIINFTMVKVGYLVQRGVASSKEDQKYHRTRLSGTYRNC